VEFKPDTLFSPCWRDLQNDIWYSIVQTRAQEQGGWKFKWVVLANLRWWSCILRQCVSEMRMITDDVRRWVRFLSSLCQLNMVPYKSRRLFWRFSNETKLFLKHQYLLLVVRVTVLKAAVDCFHKNQLLMALKLNLDSCWGIAEITGPYLCKNMFKTELSSFWILVHTSALGPISKIFRCKPCEAY
jgi:hypothetical protein